MKLESTQSSTTAKPPLLKQENGNSFKLIAETTRNDAGTSTTIIPGPVTIEEKAKKKNDVKARSMLLMALPNEHLITFNQYNDAKTLFAAIETRFGGNEATKKTQKTLLKQLNKSDLDTMSLDDLYNKFKIVEQEVRGSTSTNTSSQNMAFVSSPSPNSTNEVPTIFGVSTASPQVSTVNLSDASVYDFLANQPNGSQLVHEDIEKIHEDDLEKTNLKWQLTLLSMRAKVPRNQENKIRNQETTRRTVNVEDTSSKAMVAIDGAGFDWSYMTDDEAPTSMAFTALSDIKLEKISNEKNVIDVKIRKFENASQSLEKLIGSQITDKNKSGLGYASYNAVLPPHIGRFSPPRIDFSHTGLPKFVELCVRRYRVTPIEVVTRTSSVKLSTPVKENIGAPLIEDWESD
nr:ribonuclease H-like domain-containing protein [Tanacetum cinerariifolium]